MREIPLGSFRTLRTRLLAYLCFLLAVCGPAIAEDVTGAVPPGQAAKYAPVEVGGVVSPSPVASPGAVIRMNMTSEGRVNVALPAGSPVPVSLPASSPLVVVGPLPAGSPVGTLAGLPVAVFTAPGSGSVNVTTASVNVTQGAGAGSLNVTVQPSPVIMAAGQPAANVTLPSASPVPVMVNAYANAVGTSEYCSPSFAGGSSEVTVKGSAGTVYHLSGSNPNTVDEYWEFWDAANPTVGTDAPLLCVVIPGGSGSNNRGVYDLSINPPITFSTAITMTVVTVANGSSTPGSPLTLNVGYK